MDLPDLFNRITTVFLNFYHAPLDVKAFVVIPVSVYIAVACYYARPCRRRTLEEFSLQQVQAAERYTHFFALLWCVFVVPITGRTVIDMASPGWKGIVRDVVGIWKWGGWIWVLAMVVVFSNDHETAAYRPGSKQYIRDYRLHMLLMGKDDGDGWEIRRSYALEAYQERWSHIYADITDKPQIAYQYRTELPDSRSSRPKPPPVFVPVRGHPRAMRCWVPENDSLWKYWNGVGEEEYSEKDIDRLIMPADIFFKKWGEPKAVV